jgi:hypothetical protein
MRERNCLPECCLSGVVPSFAGEFQNKLGENSGQIKRTSACDNDKGISLERYDFSNAVQRLGPSHVY